MEDSISFYNVRKGARVSISVSDCVKCSSPTTRGTGTCWYVKATDDDGNKLSKFVSKDQWLKLDCPEESRD